ncbi:Imm1 family immunity protein [Kitasatospora sp. NPDC057198]|uniref:Imm1 family immunity protein n=1 Tax=Kitasatospora sp. NPDC057198 TaxID=3346046 RepID=UPI00362D0273
MLNVFVDGNVHYAASGADVQRIIEDFFGLNQNDDSSAVGPVARGEEIEFAFSRADVTPVESLQGFDGLLHVSANWQTGYGALKWITEDGLTFSTDSEIAGVVWISDNPTPPDFDPLVVADKDLQLHYRPQNTLPLGAVRAAIEEFCLGEVGARPACISWMPGDFSGQPLDMLIEIIEEDNSCDDPWCDNPEPNHPIH